jgi:gas vesicle protein
MKYFFVGCALGAAVGLMMAPDGGAMNKNRVWNTLKDVVYAAIDAMHGMRTRVDDITAPLLPP